MKGEITLRIECLMPEKLIARAMARGGRFDAVTRPDERTVIVCCDAASAKALLALCRRFGVPAQIIGRKGTSALRRFARRRMTLLAGLALAAAMCTFFLGHIWLIDVSFSGETAALGNAPALRARLRELGVRPGISAEKDFGLISQTLQASAGDYSFVGVHRQGVRLLVEAVPETPAPAVYDVEAARDLVCGLDGIVSSAVVYSGELCVKPGDVVRRGQLLIRGEELSGQEQTRPIAALGEVIVRTWIEGEAELPLTREEWTDTGRFSTGSRLVTPFFDWPIAEAGEYENQRTVRERIPIGGLFIPLALERITRFEVSKNKTDVGIELLKNRLSALALADAVLALGRDGPADCAVKRRWVDYEYRGGALRARAVLETESDAATTREALQGG